MCEIIWICYPNWKPKIHTEWKYIVGIVDYPQNNYQVHPITNMVLGPPLLWCHALNPKSEAMRWFLFYHKTMCCRNGDTWMPVDWYSIQWLNNGFRELSLSGVFNMLVKWVLFLDVPCTSCQSQPPPTNPTYHLSNSYSKYHSVSGTATRPNKGKGAFSNPGKANTDYILSQRQSLPTCPSTLLLITFRLTRACLSW